MIDKIIIRENNVEDGLHTIHNEIVYAMFKNDVSKKFDIILNLKWNKSSESMSFNL